MRTETERADVFTIYEVPSLVPITVVLQDLGAGNGRLIVECFGSAWSGYWGAMGNCTIAKFLSDCSPEYIASRMHPNERRMKRSEESYLLRIVAAVQLVLNRTS